MIVAAAAIGQGLFAARRFRTGDVVLKVDGRVVDYELLWKLGGTFMDNCYRFGPETYLDPGDSVGRYVDHSCDPNVAVHKWRNQLFLVAVRPISTGDELTFDYSTILGDDDVWTMRCRCRTEKCRRVVRRFTALPTGVLVDYLSRDMLPGYILDTALD